LRGERREQGLHAGESVTDAIDFGEIRHGFRIAGGGSERVNFRDEGGFFGIQRSTMPAVRYSAVKAWILVVSPPGLTPNAWANCPPRGGRRSDGRGYRWHR
jgi:hypothetical protein